ncbi:GNAT family N-acetyltransferase [Candidatus Poribacteria bacterium]|nr:GNAT family N-acetyltransferase [Candidatus Poribacteria bacterium]
MAHDGYELSTDPARLDHSVIHGFLTASYWAKGVPLETVKRSIAGSLCFGIYKDSGQVGFARVITDRATFAYLADVFILPDHRGFGLGKWLIREILAHPELQGLRRWVLLTADAHGLYAQAGFTAPAQPERYMELVNRGVYASGRGTPV